jgi:hypothetical protein
MKFKYLAFVGATLLGASQAQATSIGSYDVDPSLAVTSASSYVGSFNAHNTNAGGYPSIVALGNLLGYIYNGNTSEDRLTFNEAKTAFTGSNPNASLKGTFGASIFNNTGVDIYIFESGDAPAGPGDYSNNQFELLSASLTGANGTWVNSSLLGFVPQSQLGGSSTTFGVYVYGIDLTDLGLSTGASIAALYFGNTCGASCAGGTNNPDVEWIGGRLGSAAAEPASETPLPGALPLFASGLAAVGGMAGWRRRRAKRATV